MSKLIRCISNDGLVAISVINSTDIAAKAEQLHKTSAVATAALGRLLTAASLMGVQLKSGEQSITLRINGDGPLGSLVAVTDGFGNVRGCVDNPLVELPLNSIGKLDVGGAVGAGDLFVTKDLRMKEPYNGAVRLVSGEIAEDIAAYYAKSEQIPTVCALGVLVNPDLTVKCAGGYLVQLLPAAGEAEIDKIERSISDIPSVTQMLESGMDCMDIAKRVMSGFEIEQLDECTPQYKCNCSRERTASILKTLGDDELNDMIAAGESIKVNCHFCGNVYEFTVDELQSFLKK
ncbi:MAG: Hsp33 family molecular chaperone HslO [Acutalibacteraceae bacterium]